MSHAPLIYGIAEDDAGYGNALVAQLATHHGVRCAGQWRSAGECLRALQQVSVEVLLVDLRLGKDSGIELIQRVAMRPEPPLMLALTVEEATATVLEAIRAGAVGYLLKKASAAEIVAAMRQTKAGESPLNGVIARRLLTSLKSAPAEAEGTAELSRREREILEAMAEGLYYKEVAHRLHLAEGTVRTHIYRIYRKLQVSSRAAALKKVSKAS